MSWHDTRMKNPSANRYDQLTVVYLLTEGISTVGRAEWIPDQGYTSGQWGHCYSTNGNPHGNCTVLYWMEHPQKPEIKP